MPTFKTYNFGDPKPLKKNREPAPQFPQCILINGPSSAGKTTFMQLLQDQLPVTTVAFGIDVILYALPPKDLTAMMTGRRIERKDYSYPQLVAAHHAALRAILNTGCRVIVDTGLVTQYEKNGFENAVRGYSTLRIGLTCEDQELVQREQARGDRAIGCAVREAKTVHDDMKYDLIVDTTDGHFNDIIEQALELINTRG